jgi:uridine kinase
MPAFPAYSLLSCSVTKTRPELRQNECVCPLFTQKLRQISITLVSPGGYPYNCGVWRDLRCPSLTFKSTRLVYNMTDQSHQCVIIGIAGASASGKSLIASTLYRELRDQVGDEHIGVIPEDSYYKDQSHLSMEERVKTNYDHPSAMDHNLLFQHLQMLKSGKAIELPVYSYVDHTRTPKTVHLVPKKVIILEGILLLTDARLREEMNFSIFVDTPLDICLMRRMKRDVNERGRSMDSVMAQYQKTVRPMFLQFIEPSKQYADIIVPRGGKNRIAIDILKAKISQFFE